MTEERVTLRMEAEMLEKVDLVVENDVNIASRSHFFRVAANEKLKTIEGEYTTIKIPDGLRELLDTELSSGMYNSVDDIIAESLRERYEIREHTMREVHERIKQRNNTLRVIKK